MTTKKHIDILARLAFIALFTIGGYSLVGLSNAGTSRCGENFITQTSATAPASVEPGEQFNLYDITYTGAGFGDAEIVSEEITFRVTDGGPSRFTKRWEGSTVGSTVIPFNPQVLVAANDVGKTVVVELEEISTTTAEFGNIKCNIANGELRASLPGESLILAAVPIVAPTTLAQNQPASSTNTTSSESETTDQETSETGPLNNLSQGNSALANVARTLIVSVFGSQRPVGGATVALEGLAPKITDINGLVQFDNVPFGNYNIQVNADGDRISQELVVNKGANAGDVLAVNINVPSGTTGSVQTNIHPLAILAGIAVAAVTVALVGPVLFIMARDKLQFAFRKPQPANVPVQANSMGSVVSPAPLPVTQPVEDKRWVAPAKQAPSPPKKRVIAKPAPEKPPTPPADAKKIKKYLSKTITNQLVTFKATAQPSKNPEPTATNAPPAPVQQKNAPEPTEKPAKSSGYEVLDLAALQTPKNPGKPK